MPELSQNLKKLVFQYQIGQRLLRPKEGSQTVHVDEVASKVAAFYEKIRGVIDWREEHLLKIGAIERMLKRRLFGKMDLGSGIINAEGTAVPLVSELVRGGIFPNDQIEEARVKQVQKVVDKYAYIINNSPANASNKRPRLQLYHWLSSIAACEIEDILSPSVKERALIDFMFEAMKERIKINEGPFKVSPISKEEESVQIYIATQRALFKLDSQIISYHLLKYLYPSWTGLPEPLLNEITDSIFSIWDKIEKALNHPLGDKLYHVCERYDTAYLILGDVIAEEPANAEGRIAKPENLESLVKRFYSERLKTLKSRLGRAALYATISIFITKIALALAIEIPLDKYLFGQFNSVAITIDAIFPPLLMFFLIATIRPPAKENLNMVMMEVMKIAYTREKKDVYEVKVGRKKGFFTTLVIDLFYLISFLVSIGVIIWILHLFNFPFISYFIFIIFISLIAFAGTRLRQRAKELHITEEKEGFLNMILDLFALPLIQVGNWLTAKWRRYNIISALFNALIDMPLSIFVEFLEQWRSFLKEIKERIH